MLGISLSNDAIVKAMLTLGLFTGNYLTFQLKAG
jgi:hypothetical protein